MTADPEPKTRATFPLRGGSVLLHATGFRHPRVSLRGGEVFHAYADVTHLALGPRGLRVATRRGVWLLPRNRFLEPSDGLRLVQALRERIAAGPGGRARIERMDGLDRILAGRRGPRVAPALALACALVFALQRLVGPELEFAGMFSRDLVEAGELWRLVTANFLHAGFGHVALNALGLLVLGSLLEAILGGAALFFVVAASGLGAMGGSLAADYLHAVGASGMVAGMVGGLIWLEFRRPEIVPAPWRLQRPLLVGAVLADAVLLAFLPGIAHGAHAGGFLAGAAATFLLQRFDSTGRRLPGWLGPATAAAAGLAGAAALALVWIVWSPDDVAVRHRGLRLLSLENVRPVVLNNEAWLIAISEDPGPETLKVALKLAQRAVRDTRRQDPNLLDTLAEVQFATGDRQAAIETIDEAISLAPDVAYFQEQRRRFTGERDAEDRPEPPEQWIQPPRRPHSPLPESPGLKV